MHTLGKGLNLFMVTMVPYWVITWLMSLDTDHMTCSTCFYQPPVPV